MMKEFQLNKNLSKRLSPAKKMSLVNSQYNRLRHSMSKTVSAYLYVKRAKLSKNGKKKHLQPLTSLFPFPNIFINQSFLISKQL